MRTLLLASALIAGLFASSSAIPKPYHAFCDSLWLFASPCAEISTKLVKQIEAFSPVNGCKECRYMLVSASPLSIKANHTSLDGLQAENISFTLSPTVLTSGCRVSGMSISQSFTKILDGGLNYCNLYNLLADRDSVHGLSEELSALKANLTEERNLLNASLAEMSKKLQRLQSLSAQNQTCPTGWRMFSCTCYFISITSDSWEKGRQDCRDREGDLVVIDSPEEQEFLSKIAKQSTWIGLSDREKEGTWKWTDGTPLTLT
ncbi:hypothetical protein PAMA_002910 [Pampus argenteus]